MVNRTERSRAIREYILNNVEEHPNDIGPVTAVEFGISRQSVSRHLKRLVEEGLLSVTGKTRSREYKIKPLAQEMLCLDVTDQLQEDLVWTEKILPLVRSASQNVVRICDYGFTEILNNVIDHSESKIVNILVERDATNIRLSIVDEGVGIFNKIQKALDLADPRQALLELSKGKLTTDPESHTGEGIFFTSRMFDNFYIFSGTIGFKQSYEEDGWLLDMSESAHQQGTRVIMEIRPDAPQTMQEVFDKFATSEADFSFTRTHVGIKLAIYEGEEPVSRSQAKRIMARVDRFKEVFLDFQEISSIGPSFADEIFRVYAKQHPGVKIIPVNTTTQVERTIQRARNASSDEL